MEKTDGIYYLEKAPTSEEYNSIPYVCITKKN